jgi:drug/metabolite transporter (DMT)-like permease
MTDNRPRETASAGTVTRQAPVRSFADTLNSAAPLLFVLLWSSSFLGTRVGLRHMSPLWFVGVRMLLAAAILIVVMLALRRRWSLTATQWLHCAVAGVTTQSILLMTAHVAMTRVEAAPIALIQTLNPLLTALLAWPLLGEALRPSQVAGLLLGFAGVLLILGLAALHSQAELPSMFATIGGVFSLSCGTLYFRRYCRDIPPLPAATAQFIATAIFCMAGAVALETPRVEWTGTLVASIAWNTVAVSMGGMALYFLMLTKGTAARATVNFYLVPGVTAVLTWAVLGEHLTPLMLLGLVISSIGCWMVGRRPRLP